MLIVKALNTISNEIRDLMAKLAKEGNSINSRTIYWWIHLLVSNLGMFGISEICSAIISPPQASILGCW